jgi:hypothetical protein
MPDRVRRDGRTLDPQVWHELCLNSYKVLTDILCRHITGISVATFCATAPIMLKHGKRILCPA